MSLSLIVMFADPDLSGGLRFGLIAAILIALTALALLNVRRARRHAIVAGDEAALPVSAQHSSATNPAPDDTGSMAAVTVGHEDSHVRSALGRSFERLDGAIWRYDFAGRRLEASIAHLRETMEHRSNRRMPGAACPSGSSNPDRRDAAPDWLLRETEAGIVQGRDHGLELGDLPALIASIRT